MKKNIFRTLITSAVFLSWISTAIAVNDNPEEIAGEIIGVSLGKMIDYGAVDQWEAESIFQTLGGLAFTDKSNISFAGYACLMEQENNGINYCPTTIGFIYEAGQSGNAYRHFCTLRDAVSRKYSINFYCK